MREGADFPKVCERMRTRLVVSEPEADHDCWAYGNRYFPIKKKKKKEKCLSKKQCIAYLTKHVLAS